MTDPRAPFEPSTEDLEARLTQAARALAYPPTPDLTRVVARRLQPARRGRARGRLLLAGALLALLLVVISAVPPVRAAVLEWIRLGAVRIFLVQPTPVPAPTLLPGTATSSPTATPLASVLDLSGETSLADATAKAGFPVRLPAGMGHPQHVYEQDIISPVIVLVWMDPGQPKRVRLALFETAADNVIFQKAAPKNIVDTQVNGQPALWMDGPYLLVTGNGDETLSRLIDTGHTLVWTAGGITYRLETPLDMPAAIQVAESIGK